MSSTSTRRSRVLAGLGAALVTVGIIVAASFGYAAWRSDDGTPRSAAPTVTPSPAPSAAPTTDQQAPQDESASPDEGTSGEDSDEPDSSQEQHEGEEAPPGEWHPDHSGPPAWKKVLHGFAHDFNRATGSKKQWQQRMARWVTPHLAQAYETVDPRLLPNTTIDRTEIQSQGSDAVTAVIHYHGIQPVWVHLQPTPDGWRVTEAEPYTG